MSPQTETKVGVGFKAIVKDYRLNYYTPDYQTLETDILTATHEVLQVVHVSNFLRTACQIVRIWFSIRGAVNYAVLTLFRNRN